MAERFDLIDLNIFISKLAQSALNTPYILTADFVGALVNSMMPPIPDVARTSDQQIGDGKERRKLKKGWIIPQELPFGGSLNAETAARFGARCLGGSRTVSAELAVGAGAYDITTLMQTKAQGREPKLSTIGFDLGGFKFVYPDMAVESYEMAFSGTEDATWSATLRNTGMHKLNLLVAAIEALGFSAAHAAALAIGAAVIVPPAAPTHHDMHPAATKVTFHDGVTTVDFAADGDLISGGCSLGNGLVVDQLPGDPFLVPTERKKGAYARDIHRGARVPAARVKVYLPSDLYAFVLAQNATPITNLTYLFRSDDNIGESAYFYEQEWIAPVGEIESVASDPQGNSGAVTINFYPDTDPVTGGYWKQRTRTDNQLHQ